MEVEVIDRRYRGCAVGCGECHTCRTYQELSWALAQEKLIVSHLLAAERRQEGFREDKEKEYDDVPF